MSTEAERREIRARLAYLDAEDEFQAAKKEHQAGGLSDAEWQAVKLRHREARREMRVNRAPDPDVTAVTPDVIGGSAEEGK